MRLVGNRIAGKISCIFMNKGQPGVPWSPAEVARTKERIWNILLAPNSFVSKNLAPNEHKECGTDCWKDCDAFDRSREHPFCTHCDDVVCPKNFPKCQCCRGWFVSDVFSPPKEIKIQVRCALWSPRSQCC